MLLQTIKTLHRERPAEGLEVKGGFKLKRSLPNKVDRMKPGTGHGRSCEPDSRLNGTRSAIGSIFVRYASAGSRFLAVSCIARLRFGITIAELAGYVQITMEDGEPRLSTCGGLFVCRGAGGLFALSGNSARKSVDLVLSHGRRPGPARRRSVYPRGCIWGNIVWPFGRPNSGYVAFRRWALDDSVRKMLMIGEAVGYIFRGRQSICARVLMSAFSLILKQGIRSSFLHLICCAELPCNLTTCPTYRDSWRRFLVEFNRHQCYFILFLYYRRLFPGPHVGME